LTAPREIVVLTFGDSDCVVGTCRGAIPVTIRLSGTDSLRISTALSGTTLVIPRLIVVVVVVSVILD